MKRVKKHASASPRIAVRREKEGFQGTTFCKVGGLCQKTSVVLRLLLGCSLALEFKVLVIRTVFYNIQTVIRFQPPVDFRIDSLGSGEPHVPSVWYGRFM